MQGGGAGAGGARLCGTLRATHSKLSRRGHAHRPAAPRAPSDAPQGEYAARVHNLRSYDAVSRDLLARWAYPFVPDTNVFHKGGPWGPSSFRYGRGHTCALPLLVLSLSLSLLLATGAGGCAPWMAPPSCSSCPPHSSVAQTHAHVAPRTPACDAHSTTRRRHTGTSSL
jgi:hypothetical protein